MNSYVKINFFYAFTIKAFDMGAENIHKQAREISSDLLRIAMESTTCIGDECQMLNLR